MEDISPSVQIKRLEADVRQVLRRTDQNQLELKYRGALADLRQNLVDISIYTNGYEFSEDRLEQLDNAKTAKKWLDKAAANILKASEGDVFSAIEVAHLSAQIENIKGDLQ